MRGLWRLLAAHRDYRLLATAHLVSALGDYLLGVGLVYLVYDLTGSTARLGRDARRVGAAAGAARVRRPASWSTGGTAAAPSRPARCCRSRS